jgi:septum formation protein
MLGLPHEVRPAELDEDLLPGESPEAHVQRLATEKAWAVAASFPESLVLGGDTAVIRDGIVIGKPSGPEEAVQTLLTLSGREHLVATGLALVVPGGRKLARVDLARVTFRPFDEGEARAYVGTGEPLDKAGSYAIQGCGAALVTRVDGDYHTVVGLSVSGLMSLLEAAGWRYAFGRLEPTDMVAAP